MTIRHLRIFVTVCNEGSTSKASKKLFIAQPSISLAISELEKYYGVLLFDRIAKRLYITEVGQRFLHYALHIIEYFDEMEKSIKDFEALGTLRVGANITIGNYLFPLIVKEFETKYPNIKVNAFIGNIEDIESRLLENTIDLAIVVGTSKHPYLSSESFYEDNLVFICSNTSVYKNRTLEPTELKEASFLVREKGSATRNILVESFDKYNIPLNITWESASIKSIIEATKKDIGVAALPSFLVKDELRNKNIACFKVTELDLNRPLTILTHKHKFLSTSMNNFISTAIQTTKTILDK